MYCDYLVHDLKSQSINYLTMNQTKSVNANKTICLVIHTAFKQLSIAAL